MMFHCMYGCIYSKMVVYITIHMACYISYCCVLLPQVRAVTSVGPGNYSESFRLIVVEPPGMFVYLSDIQLFCNRCSTLLVLRWRR